MVRKQTWIIELNNLDYQTELFHILKKQKSLKVFIDTGFDIFWTPFCLLPSYL